MTLAARRDPDDFSLLRLYFLDMGLGVETRTGHGCALGGKDDEAKRVDAPLVETDGAAQVLCETRLEGRDIFSTQPYVGLSPFFRREPVVSLCEASTFSS